MAQVFKRATSPYWYARYQLDGRDHVVSTKRLSKRDAEDELKRLLAQAKDTLTVQEQTTTLVSLLDKLPAPQQAAQRQEIVRLILSGEERKLALAEAWNRWREHVNREYEPKEKTLLGCAAIWRHFEAWAKAAGVGHLHELTREQAEAYATDLWRSQVSPSTYTQHIKFLRGLFAALEHKAGLVSNVWAHLKSRMKAPDQGRRNLTIEELQRVLSAAPGNLRLMLHLGLFTGLRLGDVVNLRWAELDMQQGILRLVPLKTQRYGKRLEVPLHPMLSGLLAEHRQRSTRSEYVLPTERAAYLANTSSLTVRSRSTSSPAVSRRLSRWPQGTGGGLLCGWAFTASGTVTSACAPRHVHPSTSCRSWWATAAPR